MVTPAGLVRPEPMNGTVRLQVAHQAMARWPLNRVVRPSAEFWWVPLVVTLWVFGVLPLWRARTPVQAGYGRPGLIRLQQAPGWAPLGWVGAGLLLWAATLLHPVLGQAWAPGAWWGLRWPMGEATLYGLVHLGTLLALGGLALGLSRGSRCALHAGEFGTAAWATFRDVLRAREARWLVPLRVHYRGSRRDWGPGSSEAGVALWGPPEAAACTHYLLVGGTGSGKTASLFNHILGVPQHSHNQGQIDQIGQVCDLFLRARRRVDTLIPHLRAASR